MKENGLDRAVWHIVSRRLLRHDRLGTRRRLATARVVRIDVLGGARLSGEPGTAGGLSRHMECLLLAHLLVDLLLLFTR